MKRALLAAALLLATAMPAFASIYGGRGDTYAPNSTVGDPGESMHQPFTGWSHDGSLSDGDSFGPDPTAHENRR